MPNVLIVDDDPHIRELIILSLKHENFTFYEAYDGEDALRLTEEQKIDLAIIDVMMPAMNGWQLCQELRLIYDYPIIFLSAKSTVFDKIKGFDVGADDYIIKPFEPLELLARVKALFKRIQIQTSSILSYGPLKMNNQTYTLSLENKLVELPLKEFELLFMLASHMNQTLLRDQLLDEVWGLDFDGNPRTLDVHINRLRERLASLSSFKIQTVRGLGYRLDFYHED